MRLGFAPFIAAASVSLALAFDVRMHSRVHLPRFLNRVFLRGSDRACALGALFRHGIFTVVPSLYVYLGHRVLKLRVSAHRSISIRSRDLYGAGEFPAELAK